MENMQVLHMNKGRGETSYAENSTVQRKIISLGNSIMKEAVVDMLSNNFPESMGIADLGCSSGPNSLMVVSEITGIVSATCRLIGRRVPELRVSLNDLPGNDFNDIFESLPAFYNKLNERGLEHCFVSGVPGSFYGRLFPTQSLHFVHSSSSLHWLSQVPAALDKKVSIPPNKEKIYISKTSPVSVVEAYFSQFQNDFSVFLKSRSEEIVRGGRMVLSFMGRRSSDPSSEDSCYQWELLAQALMTMVSQGLVQEEKVDSFNAPYYAPSLEEVKCEVQREGSFLIDRLESFEVEWDGGTLGQDQVSSGQRVAKTHRAVVESMLESHFGRDIMDDLFRKYSDLADDLFSTRRAKYINLVVSMIKI